MAHFKFQYDLTKKKHIVVEFDAIVNADKAITFNKITMKPNFYDSHLLNLKPDLQVILDSDSQEYVFHQG